MVGSVFSLEFPVPMDDAIDLNYKIPQRQSVSRHDKLNNHIEIVTLTSFFSLSVSPHSGPRTLNC